MRHKHWITHIQRVNFSFDDPKLIILPLAFGKRQGREFFYNELLSLELDISSLTTAGCLPSRFITLK